MNRTARSHKDLTVWQKSMELSLQIYRLTRNFPPQETYVLASQMQRAVVSIPSNIAEGRNRGTKKDYAHFLRMAYGSVAELETQLMIAEKLEYCTPEDYTSAISLLTEIAKMLHVMIEKLSGVDRS